MFDIHVNNEYRARVFFSGLNIDKWVSNVNGDGGLIGGRSLLDILKTNSQISGEAP